MPFWKKDPQLSAIDRLLEERLYEQVLREIESGVRRDGLWAKAIQNSKGNEQEAKARYIEYRVQSIKDEAEISEKLLRANAHQQSTSRKNPLDAYDENGYTPLMLAVKSMNVDAIIDLIQRGANPSLSDNNIGTSTALNIAKLQFRRAKSEDARLAYQKIIDILEPIT